MIRSEREVLTKTTAARSIVSAIRRAPRQFPTVSSTASPVRPGAKVSESMGREVGAVLDVVMWRP